MQRNWPPVVVSVSSLSALSWFLRRHRPWLQLMQLHRILLGIYIYIYLGSYIYIYIIHLYIYIYDPSDIFVRCWHKTWVFGKCSNILSYDFNFQRVYADKNDIECHQKFVGETNKPYHEHGRIYRPFLDLECIRMIPPQTPCRNTVKYVDLYMTWNVQLIWMAVGRKLEHDMDMLSGIYIYIYICEAAIETHAMGFPPIYIYIVSIYIYIYSTWLACQAVGSQNLSVEETSLS